MWKDWRGVEEKTNEEGEVEGGKVEDTKRRRKVEGEKVEGGDRG